MLPPQCALEIIIDVLNNLFINKDVKISVMSVMHKLLELDLAARFRYESPKKNPYFCEAAKYYQIYIEIFQKLTKYHTEDKIR